MVHECDGCGRTFETLSSLRLHDCPDAEIRNAEANASDWLEQRGRSHRRERERIAHRAVDDEFVDLVDRAGAGDPTTVVTALARYERELEATLEGDDGETFRAVFWTYYKPIVEAADAVVRDDGWSFLLDVVDAYDHREDGTLSDASEVVANVVARNVIRTRLTDDVDAIPAEALRYLGSIPACDDGSFEIAWEESQHVGWAIGHSTYSVDETVLDALGADDIWAGAAVFRAFYADQRAAAPLYSEVIRNADDVEFVLDRLAHIEGEPDWSVFPRGWDVDAEFDRDFTVTLDDNVEDQLQEAIVEIGYDERLPEDWTFADLELRWG